MRLEKIVIRGGDSTTFPSAGDLIKVHYTLWLRDEGRPDEKGRKYGYQMDSCKQYVDSPRLETSRKRGVFTTQIGVGKVVRGWDILVAQMSLGEQALLKVPSQLGYGPCGFPSLIPANSDLLFEVELLQILAQTSQTLCYAEQK